MKQNFVHWLIVCLVFSFLKTIDLLGKISGITNAESKDLCIPQELMRAASINLDTKAYCIWHAFMGTAQMNR